MLKDRYFKILVVDDEPTILSIVKRVFYNDPNIEIITAENGKLALEVLEQQTVELIICDQQMPVMDGLELLRIAKEKYPDTLRILQTAHMDVNVVMKAINYGEIYRYLHKPWNVKEFHETAVQALEYYDLKDNNKRLTKLIASQNEELKELNHNLEELVQERTEEIKETQHVTIFALARLAESRDPETGDHLARIRNYASLLAHHLSQQGPYQDNIDDLYIENIIYSSPLHDIGKVGIEDSILLKPGKLTNEEFDEMKKHSLIGGRTLEDAEKMMPAEMEQHSFLTMGKNIAYYHHERWDGTGYPFALKGEGIPLSARIISLADVFDALSQNRVYKKAFDRETTVGTILAGRGSHFDPVIVDAFDVLQDQFYRILDEFKE